MSSGSVSTYISADERNGTDAKTVILDDESTDSVFDFIVLSRKKSSRTLRRHKEIVRGLLSKFNLEKTMDAYRFGPVMEYHYDINHLASACSNEFAQIRKRLIQLTGSDVIRLNDRDYTHKLLDGLNREHEQNQKKKEQRLEEAEKERLRRLVLEGIIPDEDTNKPKQNKSKKKRKKKKVKARPRTADEIHTKSREQLETYMSMKRAATHHPGNTWMEHRNVSLEDETTLVEVQSIASCPADSRESEDTPKRYHSKKHEPELIKKLHQEETVAGLYEIAAKLVAGKHD